jgi:DNA-binding PadR family transcriptional regulator
MERDPLRLSGIEELILRYLSSGREMYGLELVRESCGQLKRGTVYVTLGRMESKGLVSSRQEEKRRGAIGLPRRLHRATPFGLRVLEAWELARESLAWAEETP